MIESYSVTFKVYYLVTKLSILSGKEYRIKDRAERHDFLSSPFLLFSFLLKKRGNKKRRIDSKNRNQKVCLSSRSGSRSEITSKESFTDLSST